MATNWKKHDPLEGKRYWFVFFVICNIIRVEHAVGLNPTGPLEIYAKGHLVPSPFPPDPIRGFLQIFYNYLEPESLLSRNCELLLIILYIDINLEIYRAYTMLFSQTVSFPNLKTARLVVEIGAISFLHVTRRNLTIFNISDKALAYLFLIVIHSNPGPNKNQ